jgi:hypothetical protein
VFWIVTKKTGNTSAEKLSGRTHPMLHDDYPLHRLLFDGFDEKLWGGKNAFKFDKQQLHKAYGLQSDASGKGGCKGR